MVVPIRLANRMRRVCGALERGIESGNAENSGEPAGSRCYTSVGKASVTECAALTSSCRASVASRTIGNRGSRPRRGRRPIGMRLTRRVRTVVAASPGPYVIPRAPTPIFIAIRLIVAGGVAHSDGTIDTYAGHFAGAEHRQRQGTEPGCHPSIAHDVHFGSTLLSLSRHSINPNGAPAGSATTAA